VNQLKYPQFVLKGLELLGPCLEELLVLAVLIPLLFLLYSLQTGKYQFIPQLQQPKPEPNWSQTR